MGTFPGRRRCLTYWGSEGRRRPGFPGERLARSRTLNPAHGGSIPPPWAHHGVYAVSVTLVFVGDNLNPQQFKMVPTRALLPFAEHAGDINGPGYYEDVRDDVAAHGIREPLTLNVSTAWGAPEASLHDGNHRLRAAAELKIKRVPLRVERELPTTFPGRAYKGEFD